MLHTTDPKSCNDVEELQEWIRLLQQCYNGANKMVDLSNQMLGYAAEIRKLLEEKNECLTERVDILKGQLSDCEKFIAANRLNTTLRSN